MYSIPAIAGGKPNAEDKRSSRSETREAKRERRLAKSEVRNAPAVPHMPNQVFAASVDPELEQRYRLMMLQITAAHRVIGKLNLERDILAQHLEGLRANLPPGSAPAITQAATPHAVHVAAIPADQPRVLRAMQDFFYGGTLADVRRHRLSALGVLMAIGLTAWVAMRTGMVAFPAKISRDRLGDLPYIGDTIGYAMAIWSFFRVFRVAGRGVRWAYPSSMPRRRR